MLDEAQYRYRTCTSKVSYASRRAAKKAAGRWHVYICPYGRDHWHVTSSHR